MPQNAASLTAPNAVHSAGNRGDPTSPPQTEDQTMAVYSITVKGTKHKLEVDSDKISDDLCAYIFQKGLDSILGRGRTKLGKPEDHKSVEAFTTEAVKIAEAQVADLYAGKTRMVGGAKASKGKATAEQTEALRLAKDYTKAQIKAQGLKISRYSAKDITSAAKAYLDMDPEYFLAAARENLAKAAQRPQPRA